MLEEVGVYNDWEHDSTREFIDSGAAEAYDVQRVPNKNKAIANALQRSCTRTGAATSARRVFMTSRRLGVLAVCSAIVAPVIRKILQLYLGPFAAASTFSVVSEV